MYNYGYYAPFAGMLHVLGWVIFGFIVLWLFRAIGHGNRGRWKDFHKDSAMELLRERYVKGEISKEEFESKKKDLSS